MKIAILDTVNIDSRYTDEGITDGEKFQAFLRRVCDKCVLDIFYITDGNWPNLLEYDAFAITGSPSSANDEDDWIKHLSDLIQEIDDSHKKLMGICFGHQIIAKSLGGRVGFNPSGWIIGKHFVNIIGQREWMKPSAKQTLIYHFNQEQVIELPPRAQRITRSDLVENSGFIVDDHILGVQAHPELPKRAMLNYLSAMEGDPAYDAEVLRTARHNIESNIRPDDEIWVQWTRGFLGL